MRSLRESGGSVIDRRREGDVSDDMSVEPCETNTEKNAEMRETGKRVRILKQAE